MTTATIALAELAEKGADIDVLRQMVQFMAQRLMELDVEGRCGAGYDEKSAERLNSRNVSVRATRLDDGPDDQAVWLSGCQRWGSNSPTRLSGWVGSRSSTSRKYA